MSNPTSSSTPPPIVKLNQLEIFDYVVRYGGVGGAVRHMPYGIKQPAISAAIKQLEDNLGTPLFERRPFVLTPAGRLLHSYTGPFFDGLPEVLERVRAQHPNILRVAASRAVLRSHLRPIIKKLDQEFPGFELTLWEGLRSQIDPWFSCYKIDAAITVLEGQIPADCASQPLLSLPMVLLVPENSPIRSARQLWSTNPVPHRLIAPNPEDAITRCFEQALCKRGLRWQFGMRFTSLELIEAYVVDELGLGLSVAVPGKTLTPGVREVPLPGFPLLPIGLIWRRHANAAVQSFVQHVQAYAKTINSPASRAQAG